MDRDDASATGDWETIRDWPVEGRCNKVGTWPDNVLAIEARRLFSFVQTFSTTISPYIYIYLLDHRVSDKRPPSQTGDVIATYDTKTGFGCANRDQPGGGRCDDYEARLCCQISKSMQQTAVHGTDKMTCCKGAGGCPGRTGTTRRPPGTGSPSGTGRRTGGVRGRGGPTTWTKYRLAGWRGKKNLSTEHAGLPGLRNDPTDTKYYSS